MRTFHAALFDLDGTLVRTEEQLWEVWRELVEECGHDFRAFDYSRIIGRPDNECIAAVFGHFGIVADPGAFFTRFLQLEYERLPSLRVRDGARELVQHVRDAGLACGLVTSATDHHAKVALEVSGFAQAFSTVVTAETPGLARRKPHPDPYLLAASRLGVAPEHCVVFGDAPADVSAARAAGMAVVAMPHHHSPLETMLEADLILINPAEFRLSMI